jgi:hypothetical protein
MTLYNTGHLDFEFFADAIEHIQHDTDTTINLVPGLLMVEPNSGRVPSKGEVQLSVQYIPALSGKFKLPFQLKVLNLPVFQYNSYE